MIETPTSPAAQVARNAEAKIAQITDELAALHTQAEGWRAEMRELLAERDEGQQRKADLAATTNAARADLERARLEEELSAGTPLHAARAEAAQNASAFWDAARQDEHHALETWGKRNAEMAQRLDFLQRSLDEAAQMNQSQQAKLSVLRAAYDQAHSDHGKDEQAALEAEFAEMGERRATLAQQLAEMDQEAAALRELIPERLKDWPSLARETLSQHLDYQPGTWVRILRHWQGLAELAGDEPKAIDEPTWTAYIGQTTLHLWYLREYGPRARIMALPERRRDEPLKQFLRMLDNLDATLERLEGQERERQVTARMQG